MPSAFNEVFSDSKKKQSYLSRVLPKHDWYPHKHPDGALLFEGHRVQKIRFASGHLKSLAFEQGLKGEVFLKPLLFLDFSEVYGLMELVES
ncbi:hypothetical protein TNCT_234411 [Trichonephila clavata]|uniref:Uncharacterized protein n=1 Tax=Trichonephila clavata TaxID=2740835 RepID=A0A8X6HU38_TRICU|nr:hypothetical protein TNCT_234411 [Trichonephila clavata]